MDFFSANASFLSAYAQDNVRGERVLPNDYHPSATPSQGGDFDLSFNQDGVQGQVQVTGLNPILHQDLVFGHFD
jgi:hypothetical protein